MFRLTVLASGSSGNCTLVTTPDCRILIDAGLSAARIVERLAAAEVPLESLTGILLTHEHGDHTRGLDVLLRRHRVPVYCNAMTCQVLRDGVKTDVPWRIVPTGGTFALDGVEIETFSVPHDAVDPMGFVLRHGPAALGVLTDVGHVTTLMRAKLRGVDTLFIEANYDEDLMASDTRRPWSTKQRICSRHGHLSNDQTAELVAEVAGPELERVLLGHLSRDCNHPDKAHAAVLAALHRRERQDVEVHCTGEEASAWFPVKFRRISPPEPPPVAAAVPWPLTESGSPRTRSEPLVVPTAAWSQLELF